METETKAEATKPPKRTQLIQDAQALSEMLLRLEKEHKAIDSHAALRLAEIVQELYGARIDRRPERRNDGAKPGALAGKGESK